MTKPADTPATWKALAAKLNVTPPTLRAWRAEADSPTSKSLEDWQAWLDARLPAQGQAESAGQSIAALKTQLLIERTRKESALAGLRQLELQQKEKGLIPESFAVDRMIRTLGPLRQLIDALPRACAAQLNPQQPMVAELALRQALDERIFSEIVKIIDKFESEES